MSGRLMAGVLAAAAGKTADGANRHVAVALDLAAQPHAGQAPRGEYVALSDSHAGCFAGEKFDSAGRTTGMAAAGVELIDAGVLRQGQNQPFARGDLELARSFDS